MARRLLTGMLLLAIVTSVPASAATAAESEPLQQVQHIVVIYQENHSFDNLYGGWEGVNGLAAADAGAHDSDRPDGRAVHLPAAERPRT